MKRISFNFEPDKFVDAVVYLLGKVGPCTRMKLAKLLYLADRRHVVHHGTPILGDTYYKLTYGPIPSRGLDILEATADVVAGDAEEEDDVCRKLLQKITVRSPESKYAEYAVEQGGSFTPPALSPSEMEVLDAIIARFGKMTASQLVTLTHQHQAYLKTQNYREIDYRLFFLDEPDASDDALRYLEFSQEDRDLAEELG